jgi:hypothetical protein
MVGPVTGRRAIEALPSCVTKLFFRGDSADYYLTLLKYLVKEQIVFAISADMSLQLRKCCERIAETDWLEIQKREREVVHVAEVAFVTAGRPKSAEPLRYVAIRFTPIQRELFKEQDRGLKYVAVVTNRPKPADPGEPKESNEMSAADLVRRHREKAGTIEHVHRSMKDELGAGILHTASLSQVSPPDPRAQANRELARPPHKGAVFGKALFRPVLVRRQRPFEPSRTGRAVKPNRAALRDASNGRRLPQEYGPLG